MSAVFDIDSYQFDTGKFDYGLKSWLKLTLFYLMGVETLKTR